MELVKQEIETAISRIGNTWNVEVLNEIVRLYEKLHVLSPADQDTIGQGEKAIKYGTNDRHRIDVYSQREKPERLLPVIVFFHGGAFYQGDNDATPHIHSNIGKFFARNQCIACLATYRLVPEAVFPDGPDDVAAALRWVEKEIIRFGGDPSRVMAVGQSAGGVHLADAIFMDKVTSPLGRAVFLSAPMTFDLTQKRRLDTMTKYFNTRDEEEIRSRFTSLALFKAMKSDIPCDISIILAQFDPVEHVDGNMEFVQEYRKRCHKAPSMEIIENHNHASYVCAVGLEDGDQVGPRLLEFLRRL